MSIIIFTGNELSGYRKGQIICYIQRSFDFVCIHNLSKFF